MFWFSVKMRVKNWRKREDSALGGGFARHGGLSIRCSWSPRGSWFFGLRPENSLSRPVREPDDGRGLVSGVSVSGISNADAPHQSRNPAGWRFVTSIRFPPVSFDPIHGHLHPLFSHLSLPGCGKRRPEPQTVPQRKKSRTTKEDPRTST